MPRALTTRRHAARPPQGSAKALALAAALIFGASTAWSAPPTQTLSLSRIGGYTAVGGVGSAEIPAYDPSTQRAFVVNGAQGTVDVLDLSDPTAPTLIVSLSTSAYGPGLGGANSVAVSRGIVALAIAAEPATNPGIVALLDANSFALISTATVGALPDMLTFTPNGKTLLVANEGEPRAYNTGNAADDPEGSISIIDVRRPHAPTVRTAGFSAWNGREAELRAAGVRISGPGASAAQDLEPEYIAVSENGRTAWVSLQENNAIAIVDIARAEVTAIRPLGLKDFNREGFGLDLSDEDGGSNTNSGTALARIVPQPVLGMYQPDAIASFRIKGRNYIISANEGDGREYDGFVDEVRVRAYCATSGLDPNVFGTPANPTAAGLTFDSNFGRLRITNTPNGGENGRNAQGQCDRFVTYGARSVTIWDADIGLVWDSGDALEKLTLAASLESGGAFAFNAGHEPGTNVLDNRSSTKGPEPEGVVTARIGASTYAFVGLERVGGIVTYDVSNPKAPVLVDYINSRNGELGDRGPEGLAFVAAKDSPNGKPLLIVGHEQSGTVAIYQIDVTKGVPTGVLAR